MYQIEWYNYIIYKSLENTDFYYYETMENWRIRANFGQKPVVKIEYSFRFESTWIEEVVQEITHFGCSFNKASGCISYYFVKSIGKTLSHTFYII